MTERGSPLMQRLSEAIDAHHDATVILLGLAQELTEHCTVMLKMTERLDEFTVLSGTVVPLPLPDEPFAIPRALQGGPTRRES